MLTVDYEFYRDTYKGVRPESEFSRLSVFASAYIDEITLGRVPSDLEGLDEETILRVRLALCAVADTRGDQEAAGAGIAAETNDGVSVSYVTDDAVRRRMMYANAAVYLGPTGLLFRGVS